jgi:DNA-binding transcriptional MerR regulator
MKRVGQKFISLHSNADTCRVHRPQAFFATCGFAAFASCGGRRPLGTRQVALTLPSLEETRAVSAPPITLPRLADAIGIEYRTLHSWVQRQLIQPSMQQSSGVGIPNLFTRDDAIKAKILVDLRHAGLSLDRLGDAREHLDHDRRTLDPGALLLVNGSIMVADPDEAIPLIAREPITLVYNTRHAIQAIDAALPTDRPSEPKV